MTWNRLRCESQPIFGLLTKRTLELVMCKMCMNGGKDETIRDWRPGGYRRRYDEKQGSLGRCSPDAGQKDRN